MAETVGTAIVRVIADGRGLDADIERSLEKTRPVFAKEGQNSADEFTKNFGDRFEKSMKKFDPKLPWAERMGTSVKELTGSMDDLDSTTKRTTGRWRIFRTELGKLKTSWGDGKEGADKFGDSVGRVFGKGGRNDFLNILGRVVGSVAKLASRFTSLISPIGRAFGGLASGSEKLGTFGKIAGTAGTSLLLLGSGLAALAAVAGPLAAALSGLVGVVAALAATLSFGLAGAAGAAFGALLPLAGLVGGMIIAFKNLDDEAQKSFRGVGREFRGLADDLGQSFSDALDLGAIDKLRTKIRELRPLAHDLGGALGGVFNRFTKNLQGPEFTHFVNVIGRNLPRQVGLLGDSFINVQNIITGLFTAVQPLTDRFLTALEDVTGEISDWINSTGGQEKLVDFFDRAGDSASTLWDFLVKAGEALGLIFGSAQPHGDNIVKSLTGQLNRFIAWAKTDEGQKAMDEFFQFAEDFADKLGEAVESALELWDALDSPTGRKVLLLLLQIVTQMNYALARALRLFELLSRVIAGPAILASIDALGSAFSDAWDGITRGFDDVKRRFTGLDFSDMWDKFTEGPKRAGEAITNALGNVWDPIQRAAIQAKEKIQSAFTNLKTRLVGIDFGKMWDEFIDGPQRALEAVRGLGGKIKKAIGKVDLKDIFQLVPGGWLASKFSGAWRSIQRSIGKVDLKDIFDIPGVSWIADKFSGLVSALLRAIGKIDLKDIFEIPSLSEIADQFSGLGSMIENAIGSITPDINWPDPPGWLSKISPLATGGLVFGPTRALIGEAGAEAVVPLHRPLGQVDPAVRWLSAIAQGITPTTGSAQKIVEVGGINIITPTEDPRAVASEVVNRLVASGY